MACRPTFYRVYRKKSTEGFQSVPYVVALFSAMLWIFYALLKTNAYLLITINSFGCVIETIYVLIYLFYATKDSKVVPSSNILICIHSVGSYTLRLSIKLQLIAGIYCETCRASQRGHLRLDPSLDSASGRGPEKSSNSRVDLRWLLDQRLRCSPQHHCQYIYMFSFREMKENL